MKYVIPFVILSVILITIGCGDENKSIGATPEIGAVPENDGYVDMQAAAAPSANPLSYACYEFTNPSIYDWVMIKQQEIGLIIHGSLVYEVETDLFRVHDPRCRVIMSFESDTIRISASQEDAIQSARDNNLKPHILFDCELTDYTPEWFVYVDPENNDIGDETYQSYGAVTLNIDRILGYAWVNGQLAITNDSGNPFSKYIYVSQPIMFFDTEAEANAYRNMANFRICLRNGDDDFMTCLQELSAE